MLGNARFGAVISQPSHPWTAGAAHLFTREFFRLVESRLEPEGVFVQWISTYFLDDELLRTLIATLLDVFPEVEVYAPPPGESLLFLASRTPLAVEATGAASLAAELQPDDRVIPAGERLGWMIFSSDHDFTLWPKPGTKLTIDLAGTSLELPVIGGSEAFAKATVEATR